MQMQNAHLAVASVPVQSWGELYDQDAALKTGTIFKDLDLPFFAADQIPGALTGGKCVTGVGCLAAWFSEPELLDMERRYHYLLDSEAK